MSASVLTAAQDFTFTTKGGTVLDLNGSLTMWTDSIRIRLANHEYIKRDGGEVEPLGAAQGRWSFHCTFMGPDVTKRWQQLVNTIRREPRGKIVHPRLGSINVGCEGVPSASENPETAIDLIDFQIDFVEDAVDTAVVLDSEIGPQQRAGELTDAINDATDGVNAVVTNRIANAVYSALVAAMANLKALIDLFGPSCLAAAQSTTPDFTLETQVGRVQARCQAVLKALTATLPLTLETDVSLTDARTAIYLVYAKALQLYAAAIANKPPIVNVVVPQTMPLFPLLTRIYGKDARSHTDEVFQLNRIVAPYWIPQGTVLRMVAPSVRQ